MSGSTVDGCGAGCGGRITLGDTRRPYRGARDGIEAAWEALVRWIDGGGYRLVGDRRELCHEWHDADPTGDVMELQQPIAR